jgi:hypothetical protein
MRGAKWWQDLFTTIDGKHAQQFASYLAKDAEFRFGSAPPVHGRANVQAYVEAFFGMIGGSEHRLVHTWENAGTAVAEGLVTYTRLDGSQVQLPFVNVFYMRGDAIARYLIYIDNAPLFASG